LVLLTGCASGGNDTSAPVDGDRITIVADMYPTAYAAQQVGGDRVEVILLTAPGVEPHDLELTPRQIAQVADADLVAYVPGVIPAVEQAAKQEAPDRTVDVTAGITRLAGQAHEESGTEHADEAGSDGTAGDPHVWMDPRNMARMGATIAAALTERGLGTDWADAQLEADMRALDEEFRTGLAECATTPLVVTHEAFGYLADAYGFEQHGISGLSPEAEPSPAKLAEIATLVADEGVTTVYFESLASPAAAEAIAAETGAATAMLDPIEGSTDGKPYDTLMRDNLATLITGQGCT
jgi:zinc transport system substrate-binding protein